MGFSVSMMCWDQGCVGSVMDMGWMFDFLGWRAGLLGGRGFYDTHGEMPKDTGYRTGFFFP